MSFKVATDMAASSSGSSLDQRDGIHRIAGPACQPCVIWVVTDGWLSTLTIYTTGWSLQLLAERPEPKSAGMCRPTQLPSQYKSCPQPSPAEQDAEQSRYSSFRPPIYINMASEGWLSWSQNLQQRNLITLWGIKEYKETSRNIENHNIATVECIHGGHKTTH